MTDRDLIDISNHSKNGYIYTTNETYANILYEWVSASTFPNDTRYLKNKAYSGYFGYAGIKLNTLNYTYTDKVTYEVIMQFQNIGATWYSTPILQHGGLVGESASSGTRICTWFFDPTVNKIGAVIYDHLGQMVCLLADFYPRVDIVYYFMLSIDTTTKEAHFCINGVEIPYTFFDNGLYLTSWTSFGHLRACVLSNQYLALALRNNFTAFDTINLTKWHRFAIHHECRTETEASQTAYNFNLIFRRERLTKYSTTKALYSFNSGTGYQITDDSGNSNTLTLWTASGAYAWVTGYMLNKKQYNLLYGMAKIPNSASLQITSNITIEFHGIARITISNIDFIGKGFWWFYTSHLSGGTVILEGGEDMPDASYKLCYNSYNQTLVMLVMDSQTASQVLYEYEGGSRLVNPHQYIACQAPCTITKDEEFYVAGVWNTTTKQFRLYKNGIPLATTELDLDNKNEVSLTNTVLLKQIPWADYTSTYVNTQEVKVGAGYTNKAYTGDNWIQQQNWTVGDVAIHAKALTNAQILQNAKNLWIN